MYTIGWCKTTNQHLNNILAINIKGSILYIEHSKLATSRHSSPTTILSIHSLSLSVGLLIFFHEQRFVENNTMHIVEIICGRKFLLAW